MVESTGDDSEVGPLLKYSSKEYLQQRKGFLESKDQMWTIHTIFARLKVEGTFKAFRKTFSETIDLAHFADIYKVKPGVILAFYWKITNTIDHINIHGMDSEIADHYYSHQGKNALSVETMDDLLVAFRIFDVSYEDIKDDFVEKTATSPAHDVAYTNSLLQLHKEELQERKSDKKVLLTESSYKIRHGIWLPKLINYSDQYDDPICTFGQAHFVGEGGLISLGQNLGWKWSIFQENGEYRANCRIIERGCLKTDEWLKNLLF